MFRGMFHWLSNQTQIASNHAFGTVKVLYPHDGKSVLLYLAVLGTAALKYSIVSLVFSFVCFHEQLFAQTTEDLRSVVVKISSKDPGGMNRIGTGFVVKSQNDVTHVLTAAHVVEGNKTPSVTYFDQQDAPVGAEVQHIDPKLDLALLIVRGQVPLPKNVNTASLAVQSGLSLGEEVWTIGFPRGAGAWAVSKLNVAAQSGVDLTFSGAVSEGNSGGPLFRNGQVVAMVTATEQGWARGVPAQFLAFALAGWGVDLSAATNTDSRKPEFPATPKLAPVLRLKPIVTRTPTAPAVGIRGVDTLESDGLELGGIEFSPDGKLLGAYVGDGKFVFWDVHGKKLTRTWSPPEEYKRCYRDCDLIAAGFIPEANSHALYYITRRHAIFAFGVTDALDGNPLTLMSPKPRKPFGESEITGHGSSVLCADISPDGSVLATGSEEGTVILWDIQNRKPILELRPERKGVTTVAFSPDGRILATVSAGTIDLWELASGRPLGKAIRTVDSTSPNVRIRFSRDARLFAAYSPPGDAQLYDVKTQTEIATLGDILEPRDRVIELIFSPDGQTVITSNGDGSVSLWSVSTKQRIAREKASFEVRGLALSPDGRTLASSIPRGQVILWELLDRK